MFVALEELAQVSLGYKSLQNDFFYVNAATIDSYGIEERYVIPMLMLRDLRTDRYLQDVEATTWLFRCPDEIEDLRSTGAFRYIDAMSERPASEKKQSAGKSPRIREVLEAQSGGIWYAPKALTHKHHIWIRKP